MVISWPVMNTPEQACSIVSANLLVVFSVFASHVIKTKNCSHSVNEVKNLGYNR